MKKISDLIHKMLEALHNQKQDIDHFYFTSQMTGTELFRIYYNVEFIKRELGDLKKYLSKYQQASDDSKKDFNSTLENIKMHMSMIKAGQADMDADMKRINDLMGIQTVISGKMIQLKAELRAIWKDAEKVLDKSL